MMHALHVGACPEALPCHTKYGQVMCAIKKLLEDQGGGRTQTPDLG